MNQQTTAQRHDAVGKIVQAIDEEAISISSARDALDVLSSHTTIDDVEIDPDAIIIDDRGQFRGSLSIYVLLQYGGHADEEHVETAEAFPGTFSGHFDLTGKVIIDRIEVDTRAFYGDTLN